MADPLFMRSALLILVVQVAFCQLTGVWETRAPFPIMATEVSGASIGGFVYVVCGLTPQGSSNRLFRYNPSLDSWTELAGVPIEGGADHCNVAATGGKLYVLGAIRIGSSFIEANTWEYDPAEDRWQNAGRMNAPRGASGVSVIGANIYVAGGLAAAGSVADFEVFDTTARRWTRLRDMPTARDHLTAQAINGRVYAIAGRAGSDLTANEEYDPATNQWRSRAPIPTARGGLGSAAVDNRIQVFGGEGNSGSPEGTFRQNEEYDPATDTWRSLAPMPTPRHGLYGITIGRQVFVPAGGPRAGAFFTDMHEAFYLPPAQPSRIDDGGVKNAASGQAFFAPGTLVSIVRQADSLPFAPGEQIATRFPLPVQMSGVSVKVNNAPVPLLSVAPQQIDCLIPFEIQAVSSIVVSYAGSESASARLAPNAFRPDSAPGIFGISPERGARRGETIEIYATGLGAVSNPPAAGNSALSDPLSLTLGNVIVTLGSARAGVLYSGLAPGLAGIYQVNARIPDDAPTGDGVPVTIQVNEQGLMSNAVAIVIQ